MSLFDLAERCELASGPDRELDAMIAVALDLSAEASCPARVRLLHKRYGGNNTYAEIGEHWPRLERYTGSIDAAMKLVPEECCVDMRRFDGGSEGFAQIRSTDATPDDADDELYVESEHCATLALAVCAAALKARAASGIDTRQSQDGETRLGPKDESPTAESGDAQRPPQ